MGPTEVLATLKSAGWVLDRAPSLSSVQDRIDKSNNPFPNGIQGCVERNDVLWRFTATLDIEERRVNEITVRDRPMCPDCRASLEPTQDDLLGSDVIGGAQSPYSKSFDAKRRRALKNHAFWDCTRCDFTTDRDRDSSTNIEAVARLHAERIIESQDEPYSLPALVTQLDKVDARSVWEAYDDMVDDDDVSAQCFH